MQVCTIRVLVIVCLIVVTANGYTTQKGDVKYWQNIAKEELMKVRNKAKIDHVAKNMILFIGDGMSVSTLTATRFYKAQKAKELDPGRKVIAFEESPYIGLSKTYTDDFTVPDSAGTATSMLTGVKVNSLTVGVDSSVKFGDCSSYSSKTDLNDTVFKYARNVGMSVGVVTTTSITHATPSAAYAHSASRYWMTDADVKKAVTDVNLQKNCRDIASQFLTNAKDFNVFLGGGKQYFTSSANGGKRTDGRNIIEEWKQLQKNAKLSYNFVETKQTLQTAASTNVQRLWGIFAPDDLPYRDERSKPENANVPTLAEMVSAAIKVLSRNDKGFFLLVEGGRIDHAHHQSYGKRAMEEVLGLEDAYKTALSLTKQEDTLMIVTADHSHVFSIGGYPSRGVDILTIPDSNTESKGMGKAQDGLPFTILAYGNGPGSPNGVVRPDLTLIDTKAATFRQQGVAPLKKETHGADDVGIYARGPMAHLVDGVREENYIAHVLMYAGCLGPYRKTLTDGKMDCPKGTSGGRVGSVASQSVSAGVATTIILTFTSYLLTV